MTSTDWSTKLSSWKASLTYWSEKFKAANKSLIGNTSIRDFDSPSTFFKEMDGTKDYAILTLANGKKAFCHVNRMWIFKNPIFNGWYCLKGPTFKQIYVNARSISPPIHGVEYQVTFAHAGVNMRDYVNKKFIYPENMVSWMEGIVNLESLNRELQEFRSLPV